MAVARLAPSQQCLSRAPSLHRQRLRLSRHLATQALANHRPAQRHRTRHQTAPLRKSSLSRERVRTARRVEMANLSRRAFPPTRLDSLSVRSSILVCAGKHQHQHSATRFEMLIPKAKRAPQRKQCRTRQTRQIGATGDDVSARSSSPVIPVPATKPASPVRAAAPALDAEQQRLRCLAMQEKARNRTPKGSSSSSAPTSSDVEELRPAMQAQSKNHLRPASLNRLFRHCLVHQRSDGC